ncbi:MAG: leucyl aminopeptidase [Rhodobacter sp.]|nr:leucyl aminopeptidase [Rhodobacter sp.]MCY4242090.1 leucyl aminopeptidase [Rhodobacter sp.]
MTVPTEFSIVETDLDRIAGVPGCVALLVPEDGRLDSAGRRVDSLTGGALSRLVSSESFGKLEAGKTSALTWPAGMAAEAVHVARLRKRAKPIDVRRSGAALGKARGARNMLFMAGGPAAAGDALLGLVLGDYAFTDHKSGDPDSRGGKITVMASRLEATLGKAAGVRPLAEGVFLTRDLVNAPSNVLTTVEFAKRLKGLGELGIEVEVLDEAELVRKGFRTLLAVGQGSASPSKVVVMHWKGGGRKEPLALIGKGVVFDTGGISMKPASGMEDMTMDMGGAGVVAGVMKALALRNAKANVVGLVGLVENMPDGRAQRPGDVVRSMKGETVEVINTDAEGRLVLCDVMWYAQERFRPSAMVDLATLTGAIIVGLGHENAGVFSNDDGFCRAFLRAAEAEGEGAWRMPLGAAYDRMLKSDIADMKNVGGRPAGAVTAAQFLQRFVKDGLPWIHLDIAGVASTKSETALAPKGASGWGVLALNRLISDRFED